jgi:hypothetical protein
LEARPTVNLRSEESRILVFVFALTVGMFIGSATNLVLRAWEWSSQDSALGGVMGLFATVAVFYVLVDPKLPK